MLSVCGAATGLLFAAGGMRLLTGMLPVHLPPWMEIRVDARVGVFLGVTAIVTGLVAGLTPALRSGSRDLHTALKEGSRGSSEAVRHRRLRGGLVIGEVALALVILVGAGLLLRSVWRLHQVDLGFRTDNALTFRVELGWAAYGTLEKMNAFHHRVIDQLRTLPGVEAITFDNNLPMSGKPRDPSAIRRFGQSLDEEARNPYVNVHQVGPDYFRTMRIALMRGRDFVETDRPESEPSVIINQRLAERLWPGEDPLGRRLQFQNTARPEVWLTVIGVSRSTLQHELDGEAGFDIYRPYTQSGTAGPYYVIRTAGDPRAITKQATAIIGQSDPNQSFLDVLSYSQRVANRMWQRRLAAALFSAFGALSLVLAAIGIYGVLSQQINQQTREIGVRIALGAKARDVVALVVGRGLSLAAAGTGLGLLLAWALSRYLSSMLYTVDPVDPLTFLVAPLTLVGIAALSCYLPARRASRVDPIVALRAQ
jgi:putative ABC transport system permease protein